MDPMTILAAIQAATLLINEGRKIMEERKQNREMTPEEEKAWDKYVQEQTGKPHWKPSGQ